MQRVRLMALGGLDENGKNMYVIEIDEDIFVIETGIKYPNESEQLGVEYIIPDFSYIIENKDRVKAVFISNGHDDSMAALPHLLKEADLPVYATALTARIISDELERYGLKNKKINIVRRKDAVNIAGHIIRTFPVMQSLPDGIGIMFETDAGLVVYTGEFIIDVDSKNKAFFMDIGIFAEVGKHEVLALLTESGGASRPGYTAPKHRISESVSHMFENATGRIIITLYEQNLFRIIEVLELAAMSKRKVYFHNKEHVRLLKHVEELGYWSIPKGVILEEKEFSNDLNDVICVVSGNGNKVFRLVSKIAIGEDDRLKFRSDDLVIIASPVVPGTEKDASAMENDLYKADVWVEKLNAREILSMHASIEDLKMLLYFVKPKYYLPIKGEYASLIANADLAVEMGYTPDKIVVLDNGQFATFENGKLVSTRDLLELNDMLIDASDRTDVSSMVLRDRETLSTDGVIVVGVVLDFNTKEVIGGPDVQSRGVIYLKDAEHILNEIGNIIINKIETAKAENRYENMQCRLEAKEEMTRFVLKETGKKPMILPAIVEISTGDE